MSSTAETDQKKYKGVRRRKWGKWVSEIRVPGTQERLWLGSYSTPEAAATAHDIAFYCLRGPSSADGLNFPDLMLPASVQVSMSPKSIQKAASDAGMAIDAQMILTRLPKNGVNDHDSVVIQGVNDSANDSRSREGNETNQEGLDISVDDYL